MNSNAHKGSSLETEAQHKRKRKGRMIAAVVCILLLLAVGVTLTAFSLYAQAQTKKIPAMSFKDCLVYTLDENPDGRITVGVIQDGQMSYTVYGEDGEELPGKLHTYEIGSLTKTFTAALVQKAVAEGRICLDDTLDAYLSLPAGNSYPTIAELLTHTSGYRDYYFALPMAGNFLAGRNDFCGITGDMVLNGIQSLNMQEPSYPFRYSNYGYAVLGCVLERVYGEEYTALVNRFADVLGLSATHISDGKGDLGHCWDWRENDAYMSAGALTSNMEDMLKYAQLQLDGGEIFGECHKAIKIIDAASASNEAININIDAVGMAWIIDAENALVWHNGGTGNYNCYLGLRPENGTAVVVLSNLAPSYRIPATVMGVKLLMEME